MALYPCPACENKLSENAQTCPKCGEPLSEGWHIKAAKKEVSELFLGWVILIVIGGSIWFFFNDDLRQGWADLKQAWNEAGLTTQEECEDRSLAYFMSHEFVERNLKSPSNAEFPSPDRDGVFVSYVGACRHLVSAFVDAQNSFGATIRTYYTTIMEYDVEDGQWFNRTNTLVIDEDRGAVANKAEELRAIYQSPN